MPRPNLASDPADPSFIYGAAPCAQPGGNPTSPFIQRMEKSPIRCVDVACFAISCAGFARENLSTRMRRTGINHCLNAGESVRLHL